MKALVLNSGGVDSTTCLALAIDKYGAENVVTARAYYGQRHGKELECAKRIAEHYGIQFYDLDLCNVFAHSDCALLKLSPNKIEHSSYDQQIAESHGQGVATYVPFRNGVFVSCAASLALQVFKGEETTLFAGMHKEDVIGRAYADCDSNFVDYMAKAISIGTYEKIHLVAPFVDMTKAEIVRVGLSLDVPYELTWSCYEGGEKACGKCATCLARLEAFAKNNATDPIAYEE